MPAAETKKPADIAGIFTMSNPYLFIEPGQVYENTLFIRDIDDVRHLHGPLRMKPGDTAYVSDNKSFRYRAELESINKFEAQFRILEKTHIQEKLPRITLYQCLLKKNAMEYAVQKTTEIGVSAIMPVISERTVPDPGSKSQKIKRWQRISDEASRQSKRDFKCPVLAPSALEDIDIGSHEYFFVPYEAASGNKDLAGSFRALSHAASIAYLIGPEGGFSPGEAGSLREKGAVLLRLGDNILRAETAAAYFLSVIDFYIRTGF
jgi:16S rRNA (uracil1498-N3)-methyltransferase